MVKPHFCFSLRHGNGQTGGMPNTRTSYMRTMTFRAFGSRVPDVLGLLILITLGVIYVAKLGAIVDLSLYDETLVLDWGRHLFSRPFALPTYSPFYAAWYGFLSLFRTDPVDLYYFNLQALTVLLPVSFYLVLRSLYVQPFFALLAGCALLYGRANAPIFTIVSHLASGRLRH
jgi:hypothetical protein